MVISDNYPQSIQFVCSSESGYFWRTSLSVLQTEITEILITESNYRRRDGSRCLVGEMMWGEFRKPLNHKLELVKLRSLMIISEHQHQQWGGLHKRSDASIHSANHCMDFNWTGANQALAIYSNASAKQSLLEHTIKFIVCAWLYA